MSPGDWRQNAAAALDRKFVAFKHSIDTTYRLYKVRDENPTGVEWDLAGPGFLPTFPGRCVAQSEDIEAVEAALRLLS